MDGAGASYVQLDTRPKWRKMKPEETHRDYLVTFTSAEKLQILEQIKFPIQT